MKKLLIGISIILTGIILYKKNKKVKEKVDVFANTIKQIYVNRKNPLKEKIKAELRNGKKINDVVNGIVEKVTEEVQNENV